MHPYITLPSLTLPSYSTIIVAAFILVFIVTNIAGRHFGLHFYVTIEAFLYSTVFMLIGGKLLYFFTCHSWDGMVFYGGLLGGALGMHFTALKYKIQPLALLDFYCPFVAFLHGVGRIGCLLGGCCYGMEYDGIFSVIYPENSLTKNFFGVPRFPTPILESLGLFLLCGILILVLLQKEKRQLIDGVLWGMYLIFYSVLRFLLEFTRGDSIRGFLGVLSVSQWISLFLFVAALLLFLRIYRKDKKSEAKNHLQIFK